MFVVVLICPVESQISQLCFIFKKKDIICIKLPFQLYDCVLLTGLMPRLVTTNCIMMASIMLEINVMTPCMSWWLRDFSHFTWRHMQDLTLN